MPAVLLPGALPLVTSTSYLLFLAASRSSSASQGCDEFSGNQSTNINSLPTSSLQTETCRLFPGFFGLALQGALGLVSFGSLFFKWFWEGPPRRTPFAFGRDCSKQVFGSLLLHVWNLVLALLFGRHHSRNVRVAAMDECDWYFINIVMDCVFGVFINYFLLKSSEKLLGYKSGVYYLQGSSVNTTAVGGAGGSSNDACNLRGRQEAGSSFARRRDEPLLLPAGDTINTGEKNLNEEVSSRRNNVAPGLSSSDCNFESPGHDININQDVVDNFNINSQQQAAVPTSYAFQLSIWLVIVSVMKLLLAVVFAVCAEGLAVCTDLLLDDPLGWLAQNFGLSAHQEALWKLVLVMVATPGFMNTVQLWISDNFLKASSNNSASSPSRGVAGGNLGGGGGNLGQHCGGVLLNS